MADTTVYTPDLLRQLLDYCPDTGALTWKARGPDFFVGHATGNATAWNKRYAGKTAFADRRDRNYSTSTILGKRVMAHRVAWCHFHNSTIPDGMLIDHINGDTHDNRIANLRMASARQNAVNVRNHRKGLRGAAFHKPTGKWQASIRMHLGTYETEEEAAAAYEFMAAKIHGDFYLPNGKRITVSRVL